MSDGSVVLAALERWVSWVVARPRLTLLALLAVTAAAGFIAVDRYALNSRLGDLIAQEADWRDDYDAFQEAFPQLVETAIVVVSGSEFRQVDKQSRRLESAIAADEDLFVDVYAPANEAFFSDNALLYLGLPQLDDLADQLAQAQPMLAAVNRDPSLRGVLELVVSGAVNEAPEGFVRTIERLQHSAAAALAKQDATIHWRDEFLRGESTGNNDSDDALSAEPQKHYRLIFLRGKQNFGVALPNAQVVGRLREIIGAHAPDPRQSGDLKVSLTGEVTLRHDEVAAATGGVKIAGVVALVLLAVVLAFGVRSLRIVLGTFLLLLVGAVWTAAWAMLAVGSFNTLSLVFLVMFFGLGVDFCVHYSLRVQEAAARHSIHQEGPIAAQTLRFATGSVGGAILLCTLTTAIGFMGFSPTAYRGLADLGVISAGGMVVACILTFTLLPAFYSAFGLPSKTSLQLRLGSNAVSWLGNHRSKVFVVLGLLVAGALWLAPRMQFDYSVLALRDPGAESMQALRELQRENQITDYALYTLAPPEELAQQKQLEALDTVDQVITPLDYLPTDVEDKLYSLEDLQELLGGSLASQSAVEPPGVEELRASVRGTADDLQPKAGALSSAELRRQLSQFADLLERMATADDQVLLAWQTGVVDTLVTEINWLQRAIQAEEPRFEDLPEKLRSRLVAPDGRYLNAVLPAEDITPVTALTRFVDSVRGQSNATTGRATGRPVVEWGIGKIVLGSFQIALGFALGGIFLTLLLVMRSFRDTLLVLTPLVLTALFTLATSVLLDVAINMASVLVLPLIFGLGVDNGIHMVERYRLAEKGTQDFMQSSTPRAVLLSTLTTIGTFAALMLSPHAGTASIGFLLTVAVGYLLVFTVLLLPLFLSLTSNQPKGAAR